MEDITRKINDIINNSLKNGLPEDFEKKIKETLSNISDNVYSEINNSYKREENNINSVYKDVKRSINSASDILKDSINLVSDSLKTGIGSVSESLNKSLNSASKNVKESIDNTAQNMGIVKERRNFPVKKMRAGSVSGFFSVFFGGWGIFIFGIIAVYSLLENIYDAVGIVCTLIFAAFIWLFISGKRALSRGKRFKRYLAAMNEKGYFTAGEFAEENAFDEEILIKDMKIFIKKGVFPEGYLDEKKGVFCASDELKREYIRSLAAAAERRNIIENETDAERNNREMTEIKRDYIREMSICREQTEDSEMKSKITENISIAGDIFNRLSEKPELADKGRRFIQYYIPLTKSIVLAYEKFEEQPENENTAKSMTEIKKTMDTVNKSFKNLFAELYDDEVIDVNSNISVLKTMLANDGFTSDDISDKKY